MDLLRTEGSVYLPELCEVWREKEKFEKRKFTSELIPLLLDQWQGLHGPLPGLNLTRRNPYMQFVALLRDSSEFDICGLDLGSDYLKRPSKIREFLDFATKLYDLLNPFYGEIWSLEMVRKIKQRGQYMWPQVDPVKLGLQDPAWAIFLGPEYVDMIGHEQVFSSPCHRVLELSDHGALIILTESPFDFENDLENFNRKRDALRAHLGEDLFYKGDEGTATRFPDFRFWKERQTLIQEFHSKAAKVKPMSPSELRIAKEWIARLEEFSEGLRASFRTYNDALDYSEKSLDSLEEYISSSSGAKKLEDLEREAGAYLGLVTQKRFGGQWRVDSFYKTPALDIPKPGSVLSPEFEPFKGGRLPFQPGPEDAPDVLVDDTLIRVWPFSKVRRILKSGGRRRELEYYMDAIRKGLGMKGRTMIRIP